MENIDNSLDLLQLYMDEVSNYKPLTKEDEYQTAIKAQNGDIEAKKKLINHNLRIVIKFAKQFKNTDTPLTDLIQYGNEGLIKAVEKFNPEMECRLITYAEWWIKQSIMKGITSEYRLVKIPDYLQQDIIRIKKIYSEITSNKGRNATREELIEKMLQTKINKSFHENTKYNIDNCPNIPEKYREEYIKTGSVKHKNYDKERIIIRFNKEYNLNFLKDLKEFQKDYYEDLLERITIYIHQEYISINEEIGEENSPLEEFIPDNREYMMPEKEYLKHEQKEIVEQLLNESKLTPKEIEIIKLRFGLSNRKKMTTEEISKVFNSTIKKNNNNYLIQELKDVTQKLKENPEELEILKSPYLQTVIFTPKEIELLRLKYNITDNNPKTLEEIGQIFGVTRERIRQIEDKTLKKLRIKANKYI